MPVCGSDAFVEIMLTRFRARRSRPFAWSHCLVRVLLMKKYRSKEDGMKRAQLVGALIACMALAACNDDSLPPGGTYQTMQGVVVDAATNQPIAGATVTVDTVL